MHDIAHAAADAARVPSFDDVLTRGRKRRTRRGALMVGAAAVAVAAVIGTGQVLDSDGGPVQPAPNVPRPSLPVGSEPTIIPYAVDGVLHVGAVAIETDLTDIRFASGTTVVGRTGEDGSEWYLVVGDRLEPIVRVDRSVRVHLSPDGRAVVWIDAAARDVRTLVVWDIESRSVDDSIDIPVDVECCDQVGELFINSVTTDHRVIFATRQTMIWVPGQEPVRVRGVTQKLPSFPWPRGVMLQDPRGRGVVGAVSDAGTIRPVGATESAETGVWSPRGRTFLLSTFDGQISVQSGAAGEPRFIHPPEISGRSQLWIPVGWESEDHYVLSDNGRFPLARCSVADDHCDLLDDEPSGEPVWPVLSPR